MKAPDLSWREITEHYAPSKGIDDWRKLYSSKHWRKGYSAHELAYSWENANPELPPDVQSLFYGPVKLLVATPEHATPLPGGRSASQSDILAFIGIKNRVCAVTVEGKVDEPFDKTVGKWLENASAGKIKRLKYISEDLGSEELGSYQPADEIRYQLLHRTASAVIEAKRFNADCAAMVVHSFSPEQKGFEEYSRFLTSFGIHSAKPGKLYKTDKPGMTLYFGWATSQKQPTATADATAVAKTTAPPKLATPTAKITDTPAPLTQPNKTQPTAIIIGSIALLALVVCVIFVIFRRRTSRTTNKASEADVNADKEDLGDGKGLLFQNYVESLLVNRENVDLLNRPNKFGYPHFEINIRDTKHRISLECKWRKAFYEGQYDVITSKQFFHRIGNLMALYTPSPSGRGLG